MTASNLSTNLTILGLDSFLDMTGVLVGQQHCVARSELTHATAKLTTGRAGSSGNASHLISTATSARGDRGDA